MLLCEPQSLLQIHPPLLLPHTGWGIRLGVMAASASTLEWTETWNRQQHALTEKWRLALLQAKWHAHCAAEMQPTFLLSDARQLMKDSALIRKLFPSSLFAPTYP